MSLQNILIHTILVKRIIFLLKGNFPKFEGNPVVSVDLNNTRLRFKCKINATEKGEKVRYEVTWFQGIPRKQIKKDILSANLTESYLQNKNSITETPLFYLGHEVSTLKIFSKFVGMSLKLSLKLLQKKGKSLKTNSDRYR